MQAIKLLTELADEREMAKKKKRFAKCLDLNFKQESEVETCIRAR